jgi:hypothetical protein
MARVLCLGCHKPIPSNRDGRCPTCKNGVRRRIDANPARRARKRELYGAQHVKDRAMWVPFVDAGDVICWRCLEPIDERGPDGHVLFDLGHRPDGRSVPEHPTCNRSAQ